MKGGGEILAAFPATHYQHNKSSPCTGQTPPVATPTAPGHAQHWGASVVSLALAVTSVKPIQEGPCQAPCTLPPSRGEQGGR